VSATQEVSKDFPYLWIKIQSVLSLRKFNGKHYENNSPTFNTDLQIYEKAIPTGNSIIRMKLFKVMTT
jgi:hypothetical protein